MALGGTYSPEPTRAVTHYVCQRASARVQSLLSDQALLVDESWLAQCALTNQRAREGDYPPGFNPTRPLLAESATLVRATPRVTSKRARATQQPPASNKRRPTIPREQPHTQQLSSNTIAMNKFDFFFFFFFF